MSSKQQTPRLQIVGGQRILASDGDAEEMLNFYGALFRRLPREVRHTGNLTRYVGYHSPEGGKDFLHFLGIEVEKIESIPEGMIAWDLAANRRTVWEARNGQDAIAAQENISWRWFAQSASGDGRYVGEFSRITSTAQGCVSGKLRGRHPEPRRRISPPPPPDASVPQHDGIDVLEITLRDPDRSDARDFDISANAYVGLQASDLSVDEVCLVDYDSTWPQQFQDFAIWLQETLGPDIALRVEHYGSTAIPGMPAKPIIDVLVEIPSFARAKERAVPLFNTATWEYWWTSDHLTFVHRDKLMGHRTHHVHLAPRGHKLWDGLIFRDYLIAYPEEAARYADLKHELAASYRDDRERYTQAKSEFVREIVLKAMHHL